MRIRNFRNDILFIVSAVVFISSFVLMGVGYGYNIIVVEIFGAILFIISIILVMASVTVVVIASYSINSKYLRVGSKKIPISEIKEIKVSSRNALYKDVIVILKDGKEIKLEKARNADVMLERIKEFLR
ncbi:hypothetical protein [Acidianus sp. HS-5]|uniref:hypothetical protein n=1 Tax=Acidianus sp. HS-5 TaxID=2886040 RepID=UPI001F3A3EE0|nr:hypothetical protein [Acidianus sp. HS-5]BDC18802.1 hypothetical protein HS5_16920 [Acidianus sp. HS-5]